MQIHSVGIDLDKTTFHLVALGIAGKVLLRKKFTRKELLACTANIEACAGAHFLERALRQQGHDVRLIPAQFVKPFVKANNNDFIDAEAIAEAVERNTPRATSDGLEARKQLRIPTPTEFQGGSRRPKALQRLSPQLAHQRMTL